jgi:hypothetical protein
MAGFEIIVRPAIFPDIRPAPAQPVPPKDDPTKGFATIHGNGARSISLSYSYSSSITSSQRSEIERRVDEARIYQKDDKGKINKKNFVDIEAVNRLKVKGPPSQNTNNRPSFGSGQGPLTGDDLSGYSRNWDPEKQIWYLRKIGEKDNVEILQRNKIKKKDEPG